MRLLKAILCITTLFFILSYAQLQKEPPFVIGVTSWERTSGIWGPWIMAQNNPQLPPMYFVCGISLR
jgi:hypothetical protein